MGSHVCSEVEIQGELFSTYFTSVMSFLGMDQSMSLQFGFVQELLVASIDLANVLFLPMYNQVFLQFG
jgi:hypothetical protein